MAQRQHTKQPATPKEIHLPPLGPGLRARSWRRFLRGPDPTLLEDLYVPGLVEAVRYDRCCAYFSSSVLAAAARGFGKLIERLVAMGDGAPKPAVRLVVNEELAEKDVRALTEMGDASALEAQLQKRFKNPQDALEKRRLEMLGWLVKSGLMEVRVGVMRRSQGILHAKYGIVIDPAGEAVVFAGSSNESAQGLRGNYDQIEVSTSWGDPERHQWYAEEFKSLWKDRHPDVHTVTLPEALRLRLIKFAPPEPPTLEPVTALPRQKAAMAWRFITEAPYLPTGAGACDRTAPVEMWPHQKRVVQEVSAAWPNGRLLCDEVGMGKTIEAILVLRRLMAGRGVGRALILPPAGLLKQWQGELREKGGLIFPRLEGSSIVWPDGRVRTNVDLAVALQEDALIISRETVRLEHNLAILKTASPWDLVLLDEAHAARRRRQEEGDYNSGNLLLGLLRELQLSGHARGILLLSATPLQTHPWEPWDLLAVLGEGDGWLAEFARVRDYYGAIAAIRAGSCDQETGRRVAELIVGDPDFPPLDALGSDSRSVSAIAHRLVFHTSGEWDSIANWLRVGSPLSRRMHRNTRQTLRRYWEMGLLKEPPAQRKVEDVVFDFADAEERHIYEGIKLYIDKRFDELEQDKPGKGFVMTVYRRRASSSPLALQRSLARRRDGLRQVAERMACSTDLDIEDSPDSRDLPDLGDGDDTIRVSAAYPTDPNKARAEMAEVNHLLDDLRGLAGRDSKLDHFYDELRRVTEDGRPVLVFSEYADTMEYLREKLVTHYGVTLGCYSGDGGQRWDGLRWNTVTKDAITRALTRGELRVLVCTDAASEGLNLQAAGAVINYDLPWNPSKVEQRIGRIDRIGQKLQQIRVVNFFLKDSVDERVYRALRERCGLFEHFVGPMQPVLALARRMLLGQDVVDTGQLDAVAQQVKLDPLAEESYLESPAEAVGNGSASVTLKEMEEALSALSGDFGPKAKKEAGGQRWVISGSGLKRTVFSGHQGELEKDSNVRPLSPLAPELRALADGLWSNGERLPLVIESQRRGAFRCSAALWVGKSETIPVRTLSKLRALAESWEGEYPDVERWLAAVADVKLTAQQEVQWLEQQAARRECEALERQVSAARVRLQLELGRYLATLGGGTDELNVLFHRQMIRDRASGQRMQECFKRFGDYPEWPSSLCHELAEFADQLTEGQKRARQAFKELDAALQDPRWEAVKALAALA